MNKPSKLIIKSWPKWKQKLFKEIYKVHVENVNTQIVPGKRKRVRQEIGYTDDWKKAIVTLKEGQKIEIT